MAFPQCLLEGYQTAAGRDHPNWEEYHQAMLEQRGSVVIVVPDQVYGGNMSQTGPGEFSGLQPDLKFTLTRGQWSVSV